jgi:putative colanic acid biosynthesis acetyltransferase WcaF
MNLFLGALLTYLYNNIIGHLPIHFMRRGFLRLFNKNIHPSVVVMMHVRFLHFWNIKIHERVVINQYCLFDCRHHSIIIGHDTDIGPYSRIWTLGHDPNADDHKLYGGPSIIGHHVWIASGATILPAVTIADGTVIGAGSVVHKSTNELDIIAGNPAKFIRKRNNKLVYQLKYKPIFE